MRLSRSRSRRGDTVTILGYKAAGSWPHPASAADSWSWWLALTLADWTTGQHYDQEQVGDLALWLLAAKSLVEHWFHE
jgi:hypothetical protein